MEKELTGNEKIAKFMGLPLTKTSPKFTGGFEEVSFQNWQYDRSWIWLMPVVEKIESLKINGYEFKVSITGNDCLISSFVRFTGTEDVYFSGNGVSKIEAVYKAVLEFIDWYNKQEK